MCWPYTVYLLPTNKMCLNGFRIWIMFLQFDLLVNGAGTCGLLVYARKAEQGTPMISGVFILTDALAMHLCFQYHLRIFSRVRKLN